MKEIIKFESVDGVFFDTEQECQLHENLLELSKKIESELCISLDAGAQDIVKWLYANRDLIINYLTD